MKQSKHLRLQLMKLLPSLIYCMLSICMILSNKFLTTQITKQSCLVFYQSVFATALNLSLIGLKIIIMSDIYNTITSVCMLGFIYTAMICCNMNATATLSVPTMVVFKNSGIALTLLADWWIYSQPITHKTIVCVVVLICSAIFLARHDLDFNAIGLTWTVCALFLQTAFSILSKHVQQKQDISPLILSFYNNAIAALALPLVLTFTDREWWYEFQAEIQTAEYYTKHVLLACGFIGFLLGPSTAWCIAQTSPSHTSILGALTKVPVTVISTFVFHTEITPEGWASVAINIGCCLLYSSGSDWIPYMEQRNRLKVYVVICILLCGVYLLLDLKYEDYMPLTQQ